MLTITEEDVTTRPLNENEKIWLRQRSRHAEVDRNELLFGRPVEAGSEEREVGVGQQQFLTPDQMPTTTPPAEDNYDSWKIKELKEEGEARTPAVDFTGCSLKEHYILALRSWDLEHPETNEE